MIRRIAVKAATLLTIKRLQSTERLRRHGTHRKKGLGGEFGAPGAGADAFQDW